MTIHHKGGDNAVPMPKKKSLAADKPVDCPANPAGRCWAIATTAAAVAQTI